MVIAKARQQQSEVSKSWELLEGGFWCLCRIYVDYTRYEGWRVSKGYCRGPFLEANLRIRVLGCRRGALFLEATTVVRTFWGHARLQG